MTAGTEPSDEGFAWVVDAVLAREEPIRAARSDDLWDRFVVQLPHGAMPVDLRTAVLANLVALLSVDEQDDRETLASLVEASGHETVAQLQQEELGVLGDEPDHDLATELVLRLFPGVTAAGLADGDPVRWQDMLDVAALAALHLLLVGVDPDSADHPVVESVDDIVKIMSDGGIDDWRRYLGTIVSNPVSRYPVRLRQLALDAGHPLAAAAVEAVTVIQRERFEAAERRDVADEIRRLVGLSGLSQRQFAEMVGTSPSRLSTYVTGAVTPSAAMLLRISRVARTLARRLPSRSPADERAAARRAARRTESGRTPGAGTTDVAAVLEE